MSPVRTRVVDEFPRSGRDEVSRFWADPPPSIFRSSDIRGTATGDDPDLTESLANRIGRAFGTLCLRANTTRIVVGHDSREYSEGLSNSYINGLLSTGIHVTDIGLTTTPMVYFAQFHLGGIGGSSVTASHNPNGWGGLKLSINPPLTLTQSDMSTLKSLIVTNDYESGSGVYTSACIVNAYVDQLAERLPVDRPLHAAIDGGNSISGPIAQFALQRAGHKCTAINNELDWSFPNHEPDPERIEARQQISAAVQATSADVGLSFDGDGDRLGVTDDQGRVIWSDQILAILARDVLRRHPNRPIVYDVKCSQVVADTIREHGGIPVMWKTGHSHIKSKMQEIDAPFAGERSGHFFNAADYLGFDDACHTALWLMSILSQSKRSMSSLLSDLPQYYSAPTMHAPCRDDVTKHESVSRFRAFIETTGARRILAVDGVRAEYDDGWLLLRASSNLPALVMVVESNSDSGLEHKYSLLRQGLSVDPDVEQEWENDPWK